MEKLSKIAYVVKVYPRFSQTFVVNEILAHEEAGLPLNIFSMRLSDDTRFHESLARVQSPLHHVLTISWSKCGKRPGFFPRSSG